MEYVNPKIAKAIKDNRINVINVNQDSVQILVFADQQTANNKKIYNALNAKLDIRRAHQENVKHNFVKDLVMKGHVYNVKMGIC